MRSASQRAGLTCIATYGYRFALLELAEAEGDRSEYEALLETTLADIDANAFALSLAATLAASDGRFDEARRFADQLIAAGDSDIPASHGVGIRALIELHASGETEGLTTWLAADPLSHTKGRLILEHLTWLIDAGLSPQVLAAVVDGGDSCCSDRAIDGVVAELGNDLDTAEEIYREVIESTEGHSVVTLAQVHLGRARVARARGADEREHLDAAAARLSRWPGRLRDQIESLCGGPCPDLADPQRLTPREREVALLVTQGLTNGGIAEELFISTKTASVHVSNILSKLNMSSRTEIAAWVASGKLHDND
jgi:DNA-binding CsgD family transcriptional regulator